MKKLFIALFVSFLLTAPSTANDYWVNQLRAAPGKFPELLDFVKTTNWTVGFGPRPIMMRHSQGDRWDLMLLGPAKSACTSHDCKTARKAFASKLNDLVDYEMRFTASSETSWQQLQAEAQNTGMFHIEMFNAAAGKHDALLRQRKIENIYLEKTGQVTNAIFTVNFGSDVDFFTIGFHESFESFAKQGPPSSEEAEKAAIEAGFKSRADISFHLRELIMGHHDTLAVPVR